MAITCTAANNPTGCGHFQVTVGGMTLEIHESEIGTLSQDELEQLIRLAVRHKGIALVNLLNRVVLGDEATNVKAYTLFGPGVAITKTNIGTGYVNVLPEANGGRSLVDFTGAVEFRAILNAVLPGNGPHGIRLVRDDGQAVLFEAAAVPAQAGERELDSGWQPVPGDFTGQTLVRVEARSAFPNDDPIFRRCVLVTR